MKIDIEELGLAYRRAKADLYYTYHANSIKLVRFEKHLVESLRQIHVWLKEEEFQQIYECCFGWRLVPKGVKLKEEEKDGGAYPTVRLSDDAHTVTECELRLIEDLPVEFHVITQLWIDRVAKYFESCMSSHSYGYRLRMHKEEINLRYPGSFRLWMKQYQNWHDGALEDIHNALAKEHKHVVALTTDISAFYHNLSPRFLLSAEFRNALGVQSLSRDDETLTKLVVKMLEKWAESTPLTRGLPVGCSISSVIANLALTLLDRKLGTASNLICYGRYVDDIIFAVENVDKFSEEEEFVKWFCNVAGNITVEDNELVYNHKLISLERPAKLAFNKKKTKVFFFAGEEGIGFLDCLREQIRRRGSEWRALPELPDDPLELVRSIVAITDRHGVEVEKLRQAEEVSIRRAAFAMKLSDFADFALCLKPNDWTRQREAFLNAVSMYFTAVKPYFELNKYFPRLISIAAQGVSVESLPSMEIIEKIFQQVAKAINKAFEGELYIASRKATEFENNFNAKDALIQHICRGFCEAIATSAKDSKIREKLYGCLRRAFPDFAGLTTDIPEYDEFLLADLAQEPYKTLLFAVNDLVPRRCESAMHSLPSVENVIPKGLCQNAYQLLEMLNSVGVELIRNYAVSGLVFPTRKLSPLELYAIMPDPYSTRGKSRQIILSYLSWQSYGITPTQMLAFEHKPNRCSMLTIRDLDEDSKVDLHRDRRIALAYWRSAIKDWRCQVDESIQPDRANRYSRLMCLVNQIIKYNVRDEKADGEKKFAKVDYILFPELSMPWRWFLLIAKKVMRSGISLIAGVEYLSSLRKTMVKNEAWCSLKYSGFNFQNSVLVRIAKTAPAEEERFELEEYGKKLDSIRSLGVVRAGDVIVHGRENDSLVFSVLICSDLTDINLRARLRGQIDLLCVLAWNQDVKTFNALVTSAASDLHTYVALCNNGAYGDTRIRAPYIRDFERDIVQLKGGRNDYFVVGDIKVNALRRFHADCPSHDDPKYKPKPIGFKMSQLRKNETLCEKKQDHNLKWIRISENRLQVFGQNSEGKKVQISRPIPFSLLNTKERIMGQLGKLLKHPLTTKEVIDEFVLSCERIVGVKICG